MSWVAVALLLLGSAALPVTVLATPRDDPWVPTTSLTLSPAKPNGAGWYKTPVTVTLSATDQGSGVAQTLFRVVGDDWSTYTAPFEVDAQGASDYEFYSRDRAGNPEPSHGFLIKLDSLRPSTRVYGVTLKKGKKGSLWFKVIDPLPGCEKATVMLRIYKKKKLKKTIRVGIRTSNVMTNYRWRCRLGKGRYIIKAYATDIAGNRQKKAGIATLKVK